MKKVKRPIPFKWEKVNYRSLKALSEKVGINHATLNDWFWKGELRWKLEQRLHNDNVVYDGIDKSLEDMTNEELINLLQDYNEMLLMIIDELKRRCDNV